MTTRARSTVIVGLMGSGKTSVGRALAVARGVPFEDNDVLLAAANGTTAAEMAAARGVDALHAAEATVALDALARPGRVVALAASIADDPAVLQALRARAGDLEIVWLRARPRTLQRRLESQPCHRPSAAVLGETLEAQAARRAAAFASVATRIVDVDGSTPAELVAQIMRPVDPPRDLAPATGCAPS